MAYCDVEMVGVLDEVEAVTLQIEHVQVILAADRRRVDED